MPDQDWEHLGEVIKTHRRRSRMSQEDLAKAAGLSLRTVGNYERGRIPGSAPLVPDGYYDIAHVLGWTRASVDKVLAGGEPSLLPSSDQAPSESELNALAAPALHLTDAARDMGAPAELIDRYRLAAIALVGWMTHEVSMRPGFTLGDHHSRELGEGVSPDDAERILRSLEGDK
ncbi:helix-turn-helix transcriptional regulator [Streptomyces sp. NEAU-174]|uniref:helix-turn-helix transcriptional regulator n=1 Tax=Streptomyces sp. NEAU-174 TaxID=3458254 RepID=UPI004044D190